MDYEYVKHEGTFLRRSPSYRIDVWLAESGKWKRYSEYADDGSLVAIRHSPQVHFLHGTTVEAADLPKGAIEETT